jgi:putative ABC transport system substrate-binding protein
MICVRRRGNLRVRLQTRSEAAVKTLTLITLLTLSLGYSPTVWCAAQPGKLYRIGYLSLPPVADTPTAGRAAFLRALEKLGYVHGKNLVIEYRSGEGNAELLPEAIADLVEQKPAVIFAPSTPAALAAKQATRTIPIVIFASDPVANGIVASLAKPTGNITGVSGVQIKLNAKRLEILREAVPRASRVAVLWSRTHPSHTQELTEVASRAKELGLALELFDVTAIEDLQAAFARISANRPHAILILFDFRTQRYSGLIAEFAFRTGLPTIFGSRAPVDAGGLMSYGPNLSEMFARAATFVDRILNGADPSTLPVEQPTHFELVINRKTARTLGIRIPETLLLRASVLIE